MKRNVENLIVMIYLFAWAANNFALAGMHILFTVVSYNKPNRHKNHKSNPLLTFLVQK